VDYTLWNPEKDKFIAAKYSAKDLSGKQICKQALLNLVFNAIEAMPHGGRLSVSLACRGEMAELSVADTGCGIAPEYRARVFQLFFTTRPGGSGIGLASAFRIVQLHNGSIDFESEVGRGTTFRIELPLADSLSPSRRAAFDSIPDKQDA
jgi:signal transduction histidine kinase